MANLKKPKTKEKAEVKDLPTVPEITESKNKVIESLKKDNEIADLKTKLTTLEREGREKQRVAKKE